MIKFQTNRNRLILIAVISGFIVLFDIFTIISNIYVAPVLEGYGLPDIFIYLKLAIFLTIFLTAFSWPNKRKPTLSKDTLKNFNCDGCINSNHLLHFCVSL